MLDKLVWPVMRYGVEVWVWKKREKKKIGGEVFKVGNGSKRKNAGLHIERRATEGETEGEGREKSVRF